MASLPEREVPEKQVPEEQPLHDHLAELAKIVRFDAEMFQVPPETPEMVETTTVPETQEERVTTEPGGFGTVHHFTKQPGPIDINTEWPNYTTIRTITLPAGNYMIIAGLELTMNSVLLDEYPIRQPGIYCTLRAGPDLDKLTLAFVTFPFHSHTGATLRGATASNEPVTITLECAAADTEATVQARSTTILAMEVGEVIVY